MLTTEDVAVSSLPAAEGFDPREPYPQGRGLGDTATGTDLQGLLSACSGGGRCPSMSVSERVNSAGLH